LVKRGPEQNSPGSFIPFGVAVRTGEGFAQQIANGFNAPRVDSAGISRVPRYPHWRIRKFGLPFPSPDLSRGRSGRLNGGEAGVVVCTGSDEPGQRHEAASWIPERPGPDEGPAGRAGDDPGRGRAEPSGWCRQFPSKRVRRWSLAGIALWRRRSLKRSKIAGRVSAVRPTRAPQGAAALKRSGRNHWPPHGDATPAPHQIRGRALARPAVW